MLQRAHALLMVAVIACGTVGCRDTTVCDDAVDKLVDDCELGSGASIDGGNGECTGDTKCKADCVVNNDCDAITDEDGTSDYFDCLAECQPTPPPFP